MRTLTALSTILFLTCLTSCDNQASVNSTQKSDTSATQKAFIVDTIQTLQEPENTIKAFLSWYGDNRAKLSSFQLVDNASGENFDSTKYYSVNFSEAEKYLHTIKESGFVSPVYIDNWKNFFVKADNQFKANPQNDGPPENFDYDFVMQSQEIDEDLANSEKSRVLSKSIVDDHAFVTLVFPSTQKIKVILSRQSQNWQIDKIESETGR